MTTPENNPSSVLQNEALSRIRDAEGFLKRKGLEDVRLVFGPLAEYELEDVLGAVAEIMEIAAAAGEHEKK